MKETSAYSCSTVDIWPLTYERTHSVGDRDITLDVWALVELVKLPPKILLALTLDVKTERGVRACVCVCEREIERGREGRREGGREGEWEGGRERRAGGR